MTARKIMAYSTREKFCFPLFIWSHEWSCCKMANVCQVREMKRKKKVRELVS